MTLTSRAWNGNGPAVAEALNEALRVAMNEFGDRHGCRPMQWYLPEVNGFDRGGVIGFPGAPMYDTMAGAQVAEQWATVLGLAEQVDGLRGYRSWLGESGRIRIEIWCRAAATAVAS